MNKHDMLSSEVAKADEYERAAREYEQDGSLFQKVWMSLMLLAAMAMPYLVIFVMEAAKK